MLVNEELEKNLCEKIVKVEEELFKIDAAEGNTLLMQTLWIV
jgi:hypothetical protein